MITLTKYITSSGEIIGQIAVQDQDTAALNLSSLEAGQALLEGATDSARHYIIDGKPIARPATGLPEAHTIPASTDWTIPDVPAGTEVEIDGEAMGITDDTGLTLSFDAPGVWPVTLRPPFPWMEATCEVTVT